MPRKGFCRMQDQHDRKETTTSEEEQEDVKPDGNGISLAGGSRFLRWLDNYWYHYKWHTLIAAFFIFLVLFVVLQQAADPKADIQVVYCGPYTLTGSETEALRSACNDVMPEDFDGNGKKYTGIVRFQVYSDEELEQEARDNEGKGTVNLAYNNTQMTAFNQFCMTGEASVFLCSPYIYGQLRSRNILRPLSELWDVLPDSAADEYAIRLEDTAWYAENEALHVLPKDTLLVLTVPYSWGASAKPEVYRQHMEMFRAMASPVQE